MASKVLVPTSSFAKLQIKKSPPDATSGYVATSDPSARVAHLEHSVRFLQEQHRLMLSSLHAEIEALRHRNRDLQFQLIFNRESSPKVVTPAETQQTEHVENVEQTLEEGIGREMARLQREASTARGEARAAEARALQLQRLLDAQAVEIREQSNKKCQVCEAAAAEGAPAAEAIEANEGRESQPSRVCSVSHSGQSSPGSVEGESRAELRVRLLEAERLVRRLRAEAERARREVACMKNSLQAQLRAGTMDLGYHNSYQFPPLPHEYWPRDHRTQDIGITRPRRPLTLPDLGHATIYANNHARPRGNFETKNKRPTNSNSENISPETDNPNNAACSNRPRPRRPRNRAPPEN